MSSGGYSSSLTDAFQDWVRRDIGTVDLLFDVVAGIGPMAIAVGA
jgi:hypothetical protein